MKCSSTADLRALADRECVDSGLAALLRESGHDVAPRTPDPEVMNRADAKIDYWLTEDKDFGDLVFRQARPVLGLVLVRIDPSRRLRKGPRLLAAINRFGGSLFGHYTVIEDGRFRSRPLRSQKDTQQPERDPLSRDG